MPASLEDNASQEIASAKINLALHVRNRLTNGYHALETLFAFLDCGDKLSVSAGEGFALSIHGPFGDGLSADDNLVTRAAQLLADHAGISADATLRLEKHLPVASGIGGGSADAAATLRLLNRFWNTGYSLLELGELSVKLGADVPACLRNRICLGEGIGDDLQTVSIGSLEGVYGLLVNPLLPLLTADVFAGWDGVDRGGLTSDIVKEFGFNGRNDLEQPAIALVPVIADIIAVLEETDPLMCRMSGSGATCFGLYPNQQKAKLAEYVILDRLPDMWTMIGGLQ
ncbi:MAG: 4-(cytidine 5'-diphospho)-2-C-methyl-D-erythritol kinase [Parasphingorhabdus sp.]|uniref:4-(cytidine 5'-diphospho)-2-C-methyl-D-erythritol kinase n=1 Tax=Parasphingorhabdus sp. TaxID=2709688 RepID=UPI003299D859